MLDPGGSDTPWWVWLLVGVAALVILALATLLLLVCLRRRWKRQATKQLVMAPPAHKARTCAQPCPVAGRQLWRAMLPILTACPRKLILRTALHHVAGAGVVNASSTKHVLPLRVQQDSQESLDSPVAAAAVKSAMDQRVLTGAFDDLAAKAAETAAAAPSTGASSDASAAEAALLEAWRSRQLSSDRAADEVELGPMIGRGGFGQVTADM